MATHCRSVRAIGRRCRCSMCRVSYGAVQTRLKLGFSTTTHRRRFGSHWRQTRSRFGLTTNVKSHWLVLHGELARSLQFHDIPAAAMFSLAAKKYSMCFQKFGAHGSHLEFLLFC